MRVGLLGVGFMGWIHYLAYQRSENAKVVAFCSRDEKKRSGIGAKFKGILGLPANKSTSPACECTPTRWR